MSDDTVLNPGSGGDTYRSTQPGGTGPKTQHTKACFGGTGVATQVETSAPLPVRIGDGTDQVDVTAAGALKVDGSASTQPVSGSVTVSGPVDTELPAAAALADGASNPTAPAVGSFAHCYNGTTWDRLRGDTTNGLDVDVTRLPALPAGTNNIGDVDVLTLPALPTGDNTIGRTKLTDGTDVASVTAAGRLEVDGSGVTQPVSGTVTANAGTGTFAAGGVDAHDAAITGNPVLQGAKASAAAPADVSADNDAVRVWALRNGSQVVNLAAGGTLVPGGGGTEAAAIRVTLANDSTGLVSVDDNGGSLTVDGTVTANAGTGTFRTDGGAAHDAAVAGNPNLVAGRASAAAPADVSADGDAVSAWHLRNGAQATVLTAAGALIGGDATNGLDVDVTRVPAPLSTSGGGTEATALRVTLANDSTGLVSVDDNGGSLTVDGTVTAAGGAAHDAPVSGNPNLVAGRASAAAPADVSADGDAVSAWRLRNGAAACVLTAAGALIGGDATNGLDVDVTRVTGTVTTKETRSGTTTLTTVADNAASVTLLASNASRLGASITNDSSARLYIRLEAAVASTTNYAVSLAQHGYFEVPFGYTGEIRGIWATDPNDGAARITEYT